MNNQEMFFYLVMNNWLKRDYGMDFGWGNGYVALPKDHKYYGKSYDEINETIDVHYGLTYAREEDGYWVVGFDTAHLGDDQDKWPMSAVLNETKRLFDQLKSIK